MDGWRYEEHEGPRKGDGVQRRGICTRRKGVLLEKELKDPRPRLKDNHLASFKRGDSNKRHVRESEGAAVRDAYQDA